MDFGADCVEKIGETEDETDDRADHEDAETFADDILVGCFLFVIESLDKFVFFELGASAEEEWNL